MHSIIIMIFYNQFSYLMSAIIKECLQMVISFRLFTLIPLIWNLIFSFFDTLFHSESFCLDELKKSVELQYHLIQGINSTNDLGLDAFQVSILEILSIYQTNFPKSGHRIYHSLFDIRFGFLYH